MSDVLETCGCEGPEESAPTVFNRPGLAALDYRIGTHGTMLHRMLRRIATWSPPEDPARRPLGALTTRALDDPAIALLDAWAVTGDVLSFYQERIANEGFLRTATERRSVLELAREIGYELNPGVAASTHLVWEVEQSFAVAGQTPPGMAPPPRTVVVAAGTKVQSMPGQDELPQTFETSVELIARSDCNALRPRLTVPQPISLGSRVLYIEGIASGFVRGDRVLITSGPRYDLDDSGAPLPGVDISVLEITDVVPEADRGRTRLALDVVPKLPPPSRPPLPTTFALTANDTFVAPEPPPAPPVAPAVKEPPIYVLLPRPLTAKEIEERILAFTWRNTALMAQVALLGWNPIAIIDFLARHRITLDLSPVFEWVQVVPARDVIRPTVVSVFPPNGAEAGPGSDVVVTFSEPMDRPSVEEAVVVRRQGQPAALGTAVYDEATGTVRIEPGTLGSSNADITYTVTVDETKAKDKAGNLLAARIETTFVVRDRQPPTLVEVFPPLAPAATDRFGVDTQVRVRFSEEVDHVDENTFILRDGTGTRVAADRVRSADGSGSTLVPHAPLARSMRYTVTLTNAITDTPNGGGPGNPILPVEWSFSTVPRDHAVPKAELAVYGFREKAALFGHNAPRWRSLPKPSAGTLRDDVDPWLHSWDDPPRSIWVDSQGSSLGGDTVHLDREVRDLQPGGWAIFETATGAAAYHVTNVSARSVADYAMSGRASRLVLSQRDGSSPCEGPGAPADFRVRETAAHVRSERLRLVELPIEDPLEAGTVEIVLDGMVLGLDHGRLLALRGELIDLPGAIGDEILEVAESFHVGGFTTLVLTAGLARSYVRSTVTMNGNVVPATHGETVAREVLGGGDGTQTNQRFALRRPPLTHVSAQNPSGAVSTLVIRVDGVRWDEAPVLHGLGPRSRRYIVRATDAGVSAVIFGDGEQGARPPTGTENIVATYRSGIGRVGLLGAGRLTLLRDRPLGIAAVTNPLPTNGAADPEHRDDARVNAPLTVLTMERIVSLRDFEDFARGFAGIGKAQAVAVWRGDRHLVHLTVAAVDGALDETSALFDNLVATVSASTEPGLDVSIRSFRPRFFDVEAAVRIDPSYLAADVLATVRNAVLVAFSFERRSFGQPVTAAEIVHVVQSVPGVVATHVGALYPLTDEVEVRLEQGIARPLDPVLMAQRARLVGNAVEPAELLLVNPVGVTITERVA